MGYELFNITLQYPADSEGRAQGQGGYCKP